MCHQSIQSYGEVTISSEVLQNLGIDASNAYDLQPAGDIF